MKTLLILVGKTTDRHFQAGIADYASRITHYMPFEILTIPEIKNTKSLSGEQQKEREGELILKQLQASDTVILLDEHGAELRSIELAQWLVKRQQTARRLVFIIGGPYGFAPQVYQRANDKLSLHDWSLVTVTALIAQGLTDSSLQYHMATAKKNGVTREEMAQAITQLGFYAGWPKAWAAFRYAKEVYGNE